ncbi:hypothetical protein MegaChil _gp0081 [Megavirus chiliensis]|nr:hypothetical protein MegaChil _gp0081 [Megavirus chiliensis]
MSDILFFISYSDSDYYLISFELKEDYYVSTYSNKNFFDMAKIKYHYKDGTLLHIVEIPKNHPEIKFYNANEYNNKYLKNGPIMPESDILLDEGNNSGEYYSNVFKILETHSLFDIDTYLKYDLNIEDNDHIIDFASGYGNIKFLEWYLSSGYTLKYSELALFPNSDNMEISNWWLNSGLELKYNHRAIDNLSSAGDINVLNWWLNSGLELKYTEHSLTCYYNKDEDKNIQLLNWWINSGLEIKYDNFPITYAMMNHNLNVLDWWLNSGLELKPPNKLYCGCDDECIKVLDWWKKSGLVMDYSNVIDRASQDGYINVLNWFIGSGLELIYTRDAMNFAHNTKILQWWLNSGLELLYDDLAMTCAPDIETLEWWKTSGLSLCYDKYIIPEVIERGDISKLNWWYNSGLEFVLDENDIKSSLKDASDEIKEWWKTTTFPQYDFLNI